MENDSEWRVANGGARAEAPPHAITAWSLLAIRHSPFAPMLNLNDLVLFVHIVEHGGLSPASRALGVPKSTLSKRLLELEKAAGTRLVQRSTRSFVLTEIGRDIVRHASAMLIEAEAVENAIQGRLAEPSGTVRITAAVPIAQHRLARILPRLALAYPKIRIVVHATGRFVDIVQDGFDLAIRAHRGPLPDSDLLQRRIGREPYWLVAAPAWIRQAGPLARPEDLDGTDGIMISGAETIWQLEGADGAAASVRPTPRYHADEATLLVEAAKAGLGITSLQASVCREPIEAGLLQRVLPGWTSGAISLTLLTPHRRGQLPSVRVVADTLVEQLALV